MAGLSCDAPLPFLKPTEMNQSWLSNTYLIAAWMVLPVPTIVLVMPLVRVRPIEKEIVRSYADSINVALEHAMDTQQRVVHVDSDCRTQLIR
jgi:hypothetical protein